MLHYVNRVLCSKSIRYSIKRVTTDISKSVIFSNTHYLHILRSDGGIVVVVVDVDDKNGEGGPLQVMDVVDVRVDAGWVWTT